MTKVNNKERNKTIKQDKKTVFRSCFGLDSGFQTWELDPRAEILRRTKKRPEAKK